MYLLRDGTVWKALSSGGAVPRKTNLARSPPAFLQVLTNT